MVNKKLISGIALFIIVLVITLIISYGSNIPVFQNDQEYKQNLKEQNKKLTVLEQMQKLDIFKEKCKDVRADPNSYYPEIVDICR